MPPKGEQEVIYGGPWGGLDFSRPYNVLDPQFLAPGTVNTSQINGFLTTSPWLGQTPYNPNVFAANEWVIGIFESRVYASTAIAGGFQLTTVTIVVTNLKVYVAFGSQNAGNNVQANGLNLVHTWAGGELNPPYMVPGQAISFVEIAGTTYFTGLMLTGIFSLTIAGGAFVFAQATNYVAGQYLIELDGRLVVAQCYFPGGGGTGTSVLPTVAWSGPGLYAGVGPSDPWNPVNNLGGGFNELSDVPDVITGLAGIGRSALIFRQTGVSQIDPNPGTSNSGLQPFTFYHLWASAQGVGAFAGTVAQFGQQVLFRSSDNVYSISINAGLQGLGNRIIAKIAIDQRAADLNGTAVMASTFATGYWYFGSIVNIAGQLHYLLAFSAFKENNTGSGTTFTYVDLVYDYNLSESAWHLWDISAYFNKTGTPQPFSGFSCPITQTQDINSSSGGLGGIPSQFGLQYLLVGVLTTLTTTALGGLLNQFVPFDYDFNSNPYVYAAPAYTPQALPLTTIVFRAEVISLGHKISTRRLRIQADNAPIPGTPGGGGGLD